MTLEEMRHPAFSFSMDLETTGNGAAALISCSGYAMLQPDGSVLSWVIPLLNPFADGGRQWQDAELGTVLETMRHVHANAVPKVMQNGSYDTHYYTKYRMPVANWFFDTAVAFHSIWPEIPKRIDFICSVAVDHYRYWKAKAKRTRKMTVSLAHCQIHQLPGTATYDIVHSIAIIHYSRRCLNLKYSRKHRGQCQITSPVLDKLLGQGMLCPCEAFALTKDYKKPSVCGISRSRSRHCKTYMSW